MIVFTLNLEHIDLNVTHSATLYVNDDPYTTPMTLLAHVPHTICARANTFNVLISAIRPSSTHIVVANATSRCKFVTIRQSVNLTLALSW